MTRRRFYAPPQAFDFRTRQVSLSVDEARHLREVLRLKPGDQARVFDGKGNEYAAVITKAMRDSALLEIGQKVEPASSESPLNLTLGVALLKGEKFDLVVQKATELGITELVPVMTKFADVRLQDPADASKRVGRWQRIALEAAKQSGRATLPVIDSPVELASFLEQSDNKLRVLFAELGGESMASLHRSETIVALVGSEGGWADEELELARQHGWKIVTLGGRILRAETAAIAVVVLFQHLYGDLL